MYADQTSHADGAAFIDADYLRLELGARFANQWVLRIGTEQLSGDGTYGFQTPFATGHAYHGRADIFATRTPATGLHDQYVGVEAPIYGARVALRYHQFDSDAGDLDYGSEIDLIVSYRFKKRLQLDLEYSSYSANSFSSDKQRFALSFRYFL